MKVLGCVFALIVATIATAPMLGNAQSAPVQYELDRFEGSSIRIVQPNTSGNLKFLWNLGLGNGTTSVTTAQSQEGSRSLQSRYTGGTAWQFQFYTYTEGLAGFGNGWQFMRKFVSNPTSWQMNKVNRMRFWIKLPVGTDQAGGGNHNMELGTYLRCSSCDGAEDGGGHMYHFYDLPYTGQWHQLIVDTHPNHFRGDNGSAEQNDQLHPTNESGFTYFDLMTRFYIDFPYETFPLPADFYLDNFELYEDQRPENVNQIYSLNAVYVPSSNQVRVGWMRRKDENTVKHEVRYAFQDIYGLGWNGATAAPSGTITPPGDGGYNGMEYTSTALNLTGRTMLYVAIKPQNSSLFRQIAIPLTGGGGGTTPPAPGVPTNVRIIR